MTKLYIPPNADHSGISIDWVKTAKRLDISGWYDTCVGIESQSFTLREFFDQLGITEADCKKAWSIAKDTPKNLTTNPKGNLK